MSLAKGARAEVEFFELPYDFSEIHAASDSAGVCPLGFRCKYDPHWEPVFIDKFGDARQIIIDDEWFVKLPYKTTKSEIIGRIYFIFVDSEIKKVNHVS
jgi:hypothetical protein